MDLPKMYMTAILVVGCLGPCYAAPSEAPTLYLVAGTFANGANLPVRLCRVKPSEPSSPSFVRKLAEGVDFVLGI